MIDNKWLEHANYSKLKIRRIIVRGRNTTEQALRDRLAAALWANKRLQRELAKVELERDDLGAQLAAIWMDDDFDDADWDNDDFGVYLLASASTFDFWDNELDTQYDNDALLKWAGA